MSRSRVRRRRSDAAPTDHHERRRGRWTLLAVATLLLLTTDDRHVGSVADGRQMIWTAIAMTETGEIGQARGRDFTFARDRGDSVSRYGMGMSFAQVPAAWLAPRLERRFGPGSSQPLFLLAPLVFTVLSAFAAGRVALLLGGGGAAVIAAILLGSIASPLGSYAAMEFSEPMQAAALAVALWMALEGHSGAAGIAAGVAVLTKSANLFVAPAALLPLWRKKGIARAAVGFGAVVAIWLFFEITRFGAPFANYPGEGFTNPVWDGIWRLLFSLPEGFFIFFPAAAVALVSRTEPAVRAAVLLPSAVLLLLAAAYWGWHGNEGWGPRLILPCVPLIAPLAAVQLERWGRIPLYGVTAVCLLANVPPLVQHPTPVSTYITNLEWPRVSAKEARGIPHYARMGDRVSPDLVLAKVPLASPFIIFPWFTRATWSAPAPSATMLQNPPWIGVRPDLRPQRKITPELARYFTREPRWNFWGRGFAPEPDDVAYRAVYDEGLQDQVVRMHQHRRSRDALRLAEKLHRIAPSGESVALILETYRLLGWADEAKRFLAAQPLERRVNPKINVVLALFERDAGNEEAARRFLENAAPSFPGSPIQMVVRASLERWPGGLDAMVAEPVAQVGAR